MGAGVAALLFLSPGGGDSFTFDGRSYHRSMLLAAEVWHYYVAFPLVALAVGTIVALLIGYLKNVTGARYPRR